MIQSSLNERIDKYWPLQPFHSSDDCHSRRCTVLAIVDHLAVYCITVIGTYDTMSKQPLNLGFVGLRESGLAMGSAILQALRRRMKSFTLRKAPKGHMLNEHLWALILQHLDSLKDHVKASTCCKAAWRAGLLKLDIPAQLPTEGMSCYLGLCVLHLNMIGRGLTRRC